MRNPIFTKVRGQIVSEQVTKYITEESAFGEDSVREVQSSNKDFVITWAALDPYEFGLDETITMDDLKTAAQARENTLAELKQRSDEYRATRAAGPSAIGNIPVAPKDEEYKF